MWLSAVVHPQNLLLAVLKKATSSSSGFSQSPEPATSPTSLTEESVGLLLLGGNKQVNIILIITAYSGNLQQGENSQEQDEMLCAVLEQSHNFKAMPKQQGL